MEDEQNQKVLNCKAFLIQSCWRSFKLKKKRLEKSKSNIMLIFTSIVGQHYRIKQNTDKMELLLYLKGWNVQRNDLSENKSRQMLVKSIRTKGYELPFLFVNDFFLGNYENVQELEDLGILEDIIQEKYLERCLLCNNDRRQQTDKICNGCGRSYLFFEKKI